MTIIVSGIFSLFVVDAARNVLSAPSLLLSISASVFARYSERTTGKEQPFCLVAAAAAVPSPAFPAHDWQAFPRLPHSSSRFDAHKSQMCTSL
jgi:hypothetical protein